MGLDSAFSEIDVAKFWSEPMDKEPGTIPGYKPKDPRLVAGVKEYREAYRIWHTEPDRPDYKERALAALERAVRAYPSDGHVWIQYGIVAFHQSRFDVAREAFEQAASRKVSAHVQKVVGLYRARLKDLSGDREGALRLYREGGTGACEPKVQEAHQDGVRRPYSASRVGSLMIDLQFPDTFAY
jgi:tetratricopeptide (TPR) repeat protein